MYGARVAGRRIVELVKGGDCEAERRAGGSAARGADTEVSRGSGADGDGVAGAGDGAIGRVRGRDGLTARGRQRGAERAYAIGQRAIRRQRGRAVTTAEMAYAGVAGCRAVERVLRRHGETESGACGSAAWGAHSEMRCSRGADGDDVTRARNRTLNRVSRGERLV